MYVVNLLHLSVIVAYCFNICSGVRVISNKTDLPISKEITIKSPGYPTENYERDTIYTWMVAAPELTEEIYIEIELDVPETQGKPCYDYLKIEEIKNKFRLFKRCGKLTVNRTAKGNELKITLFSNYDTLTAKGFLLRLKVSKVSTTTTTITTTSATTSLPVAKTSLPVSKTTKKAKTKTKTTTKTKAKMKAKTKTTTTTKTTQKLFPQTTIAGITTLILSIPSSKAPSATGLATRKSIKTKISTRITSSRATQPKTSEVIMNKILSLTLTSPSTIELDKTTKSTTFITTDFQHTRTLEKPKLLSTKQNAETSTKSKLEAKGFILNQEMVILIAAVGVVEVTLIIVGIIAFKRRKQQRKCPMTRRPIETHDHRPVSRKTVCSIANVYDTIPFDEEDETCDENPYKDPSEGVYDTTSKRRSHVNHNKSNYSRGSYFSHLFRDSKSYGKRKIEENLPMFSTFRGSKKETKVLASSETPN